MKYETQNYTGTPRRYGLEIEYAGVPLDQSARIVADCTDGKIHSDHKTHYTVTAPDAGDFVVELDVELAQKISRKAKSQHDIDPNHISIEGLADMVLPEILQTVAPTEIVSPPLTAGQLPVMQDIISQLRQAGALGTRSSIFYAFGYHVNPEIKSDRTSEMRDVLRSFILLYDWIVQKIDMDITRRLSGYAAPYPASYGNLILNPDYSPDLKKLIDDYMQHMPSRNYALDAMPLFLFLDEGHVKSKQISSLIKPRPTWHFRMPNCSLAQIDWSIYSAIDIWCVVEALAEDKNTLLDFIQKYASHKPNMISGIDADWAAVTDQFAKGHYGR